MRAPEIVYWGTYGIYQSSMYSVDIYFLNYEVCSPFEWPRLDHIFICQGLAPPTFPSLSRHCHIGSQQGRFSASRKTRAVKETWERWDPVE